MLGHTFTPPFPSRFGRPLSKVQGIVWPAGFFPLQDSMSCGCHVCCLVVVVVVVTYTVSIFIYCPLFHKSQPFNTSTAGPNVDYQWFDRFMVTDKVGLFLFFAGGREGWGLTRILVVTGWGCIPTYCLICRYDIYNYIYIHDLYIYIYK